MLSSELLEAVAAFHQTFKHPILKSPELPSSKRMSLRYALLSEELKELKEAITAEDIVAVADALCDLQYVLAGAVLEFGLKDKFKRLFDEVHRSNMSKACRSEAEAVETITHYEKQGVPAYYKKVDATTYLVYRSADHKTLKSIYYSPAKLEPLLL